MDENALLLPKDAIALGKLNRWQNKSEHSTEWAGAHSASVLDVLQRNMKRKMIFLSAGFLLVLTGLIYLITQPGNLVGIDDTVIVVAEFRYITIITFLLSIALFVWGFGLIPRKNRESKES